MGFAIAGSGRKGEDGRRGRRPLCSCGELINGEPWDLAHADLAPTLYERAAHPSCNRAAPHRNKTSRRW